MRCLCGRKGLVTGLILVAASAGLNLVLGAQVGPPYWAKDHGPIAAISLYNGTYEEDDALGLHKCWRTGGSEISAKPCYGEGGVTWLISELNRRYGAGYHRFMLNLPAGHVKYDQPGIGFPSAQWHLLDTSGIETTPGSTVRQDLAALTLWLYDHPDAQILIYQGLRFNPKVREPWKSRLMIGSVAPDLSRAFDRQVVQENTKHWLALAPPITYRRDTYPIGFVFDNTGVESTRKSLIAVLQDRTLFETEVPLFISGEAIPHKRDSLNPFPEAELIRGYITSAPWMGLMRFHQTLDAYLPSWTAAPGTHLGFAVHNRECAAGHHQTQQAELCDPGYELDDDAIHAAIQSAYDRGFVIIHYGGDHDAYIINMYSQPPAGL